jgi:hypothetical protein
MRKPVPTSIKVAFGAIIGFALAAGYRELRAPTAPVPPAASAPVASTPVVIAPGKQQARDALMALPELKVWSERIAQNSGGKVHGALVEYDPTPKLVNGKKYWQLSFVENGAVAAHSWDSFLVEVGGSTILVEDYNSDKQLTLEQWRATKKPMERTKAESDS